MISNAEGDVLAVDMDRRIISVVAVPYSEIAVVPMNDGSFWRELFEPGAFDDIDVAPTDIRVNREHERIHTLGRVTAFNPRDHRGLLADVKVSRTPLGDEALVLAADGCLSASIAYGVYRSADVIIDRNTRLRRVTRAWIKHVALTPEPAYAGAKVLAVRSSGTPRLDNARRDLAAISHASSRAARGARARRLNNTPRRR